MLEDLFDFNGYGPRLLAGGFLTLQIAVFSMMIALLLGLLSASARLSSSRSLRGLSATYTTIIRGIPDLILMMLCFYGSQTLLASLTDWLYDYTDGAIDWQINIDPYYAGIGTIGFMFGAYMSETFRGAFQSVEAGQMEAARAYGMTPWQIFRRVRFPQMMRHALPGIGNNWMVLLKTTALVSLINLSDMVRVADEATKALHQPFKFMIPVALGYLVIATFSELLLKWLTNRYNVGFKEAS